LKLVTCNTGGDNNASFAYSVAEEIAKLGFKPIVKAANGYLLYVPEYKKVFRKYPKHHPLTALLKGFNKDAVKSIASALTEFLYLNEKLDIAAFENALTAIVRWNSPKHQFLAKHGLDIAKTILGTPSEDTPEYGHVQQLANALRALPETVRGKDEAAGKVEEALTMLKKNVGTVWAQVGKWETTEYKYKQDDKLNQAPNAPGIILTLPYGAPRIVRLAYRTS
jgi:hypothetical protein